MKTILFAAVRAHTNDSPFPWHHGPDTPKGHHSIPNDYRLMDGDICWHMDDDMWHPVCREGIGKNGKERGGGGYIQLARPNRNNLLAIARRNASSIKWQPMRTADKHCTPMLFRVEGKITMGRSQSIGPRYNRQGWFEEDFHFHTSDKRLYPDAWAPLPECY